MVDQFAAGMQGKMLQLMREVYSNVKATVHTDEDLTNFKVS